MNQLQSKLEQLTAKAIEDPTLYDQLTTVESVEQLSQICRALGIELSASEAAKGFEMLLDLLAEGESRALSDAELDRVAAGVNHVAYKTGSSGW